MPAELEARRLPVFMVARHPGHPAEAVYEGVKERCRCGQQVGPKEETQARVGRLEA